MSSAFEEMRKTKAWVKNLIEIPMDLMEMLQEEDSKEVTCPVWGDAVQFYDCEDGDITGEVKSVDWTENSVMVEADDSFKLYLVHSDSVKVIHRDRFPKNDVVWAFRGEEDTKWAYRHYRQISMVGFRIYEVGNLVVIAADKVDNMYVTYWKSLWNIKEKGAA